MNGDQYYQLLLDGERHHRHPAGRRHHGVHLHLRRPRASTARRSRLNKGMVGMGSDNARGVFDNVAVQVLPPQVTYDNTRRPEPEHLAARPRLVRHVAGPGGDRHDRHRGHHRRRRPGPHRHRPPGGQHVVGGRHQHADAGADLVRRGDVRRLHRRRLQARRPRHGRASGSCSATWTRGAGGPSTCPSPRRCRLDTAYTLQLNLKGTSVSATLNGAFVASTAYNAGVVDGRFGLVVRSGSAAFTSRARADRRPGLPDHRGRTAPHPWSRP